MNKMAKVIAGEYDSKTQSLIDNGYFYDHIPKLNVVIASNSEDEGAKSYLRAIKAKAAQSGFEVDVTNNIDYPMGYDGYININRDPCLRFDTWDEWFKRDLDRQSENWRRERAAYGNDARLSFFPCTAEAVTRVLQESRKYGYPPYTAVIGRSAALGKPLAQALMSPEILDASVAQFHSGSDLEYVFDDVAGCRFDAIVSCAGARTLDADMFCWEFMNEDTPVISVGCHKDKNGKWQEDIQLDAFDEDRLNYFSSSDIGLITTSILINRLAEAALSVRGEM